MFCNAHNALFVEHLNVLPDWDMFRTDHAYSRFHGVARCLSGGPIYVTEIPGKHDVSLIQEMTAKSLSGRSITLRPERLGRTPDIYVAHSKARLLRVLTTHQGALMLSFFNMGQFPTREIIGLVDFEGRVADTPYILIISTLGALFKAFTK